MIKLSICLSCENKELKLLYNFGNLPAVNNFYAEKDIFNEKPYPLVLNYCKECFLIQLNDVPPAEDLYQNYHHKSSASAGNIKHLESFSNFIAENYNLDTKILEIGSNDSTLLNLLNKAGYQCIGVDPAKNLNQNHKNVITDFFNLKILQKISNKFD